MGMGDVKFIAAISSFLGALSLIWTIVISSFIGAFLGILLIVVQRGSWGTRIPYGPFLGMAAIFWLFGGSYVTHAYINSVLHNWNLTHAPFVAQPGVLLLP
jgi:leader peptidase (prepilin peptidase)/N-methyltransferase